MPDGCSADLENSREREGAERRMTNQDPKPDTGTGQPPAGESGTATVSNVNKPWLIRIVIITACLLGYAAWSVYDAYVAYPAKGESYASWAEWKYLETAIEADRTELPGILRREAVVADPAEELSRLKSDSVRTQNESDLAGGTRQKRAEMEIARQTWLQALSVIGRLDPAYTSFYRSPDVEAAEQLAELSAAGSGGEAVSGLASRLDQATPRERFNELSQRWTVESPPAALRSYDIPVNKIQAVLCVGFAVYLISLFARVAVRTYRWDPATKTLTLPTGESISPDDLEDVDKRKWDKFIVFLLIKDSHTQLGGREIRFDTYRHGHVESWILEMERVAFPDRAEEAEDGTEDQEAEPREPAASADDAG